MEHLKKYIYFNLKLPNVSYYLSTKASIFLLLREVVDGATVFISGFDDTLFS